MAKIKTEGGVIMKSKLEKNFSDFRKGWLLLVILILVAPLSAAMAKETKFKAMSRNLYLGADIFRVVEAAQTDPDSVPYAVADVFQTMLATNFSARAEGIADEIANAKPDVIGLQEVSTFYIQTPGDFLIGNPVKANELVIDFYAVLNAALKARGMYYKAFTVTNADVELPMIDPNSPTYLSDVRLVDHDVILVRKEHHVMGALAQNYSLNVGMDLGGAYVEFTRGFLVVYTVIKDESFRFVNTHLEINGLPDSVYRYVQSMQMLELLVYLAVPPYPNPIVILGDFNSAPEDVPGVYYDPDYGPLNYTPPYMQAVAAKYLDTWLLQKKYDEGYTSGFDEYVSDPDAKLTTRIDFVFLKPSNLKADKVLCDVVGDKVSDMVPNPDNPGFYLWPSDHAGVVTKVKFLKSKKKYHH
jgi:endonuclease/exonuclease/phosphatase family metal-dependent hydrolase